MLYELASLLFGRRLRVDQHRQRRLGVAVTVDAPRRVTAAIKASRHALKTMLRDHLLRDGELSLNLRPGVTANLEARRRGPVPREVAAQLAEPCGKEVRISGSLGQVGA